MNFLFYFRGRPLHRLTPLLARLFGRLIAWYWQRELRRRPQGGANAV
jgi:hypothetical protein